MGLPSDAVGTWVITSRRKWTYRVKLILDCRCLQDAHAEVPTPRELCN